MADWEGALILGLLSGLAAFGIVVSAIRGRVPLLFAGAVLGGWAAVMIAAGAWFASCTRCTSHISYDSARAVTSGWPYTESASWSLASWVLRGWAPSCRYY